MQAQREPVRAYIALGANLGDPQTAILTAIEALAAVEGIELLQRSSLYRSAPLGASGPDYVNAVVAVQTRLSAPTLLVSLQQLEDQAGRRRSYRNAPRLLDLDLLTYGEARIDSATLVVPHPRMYERAFVLLPLAEIAPEQVSEDRLRAVQGQVTVRL